VVVSGCSDWYAVLRKSKAAGPGCDQLLTLAAPLDWWRASCSRLCCAKAGASLVAVTIVLVVVVVLGWWWWWWYSRGVFECKTGR
jgi:hypothetical protein